MKLSISVVLLVGLKAFFVNSEDKNIYGITRKIVLESVHLPGHMHGLIIGRFVLLPKSSREKLMEIVKIGFKKKIPVYEYEVDIIEAILSWKRYRNKSSLNQAMENVKIKIEEMPAIAQPKTLDFDVATKINMDYCKQAVWDFKISDIFYTDRDLGSENKLKPLDYIIQVLPEMCFWKIVIMRLIIDNIDEPKFKPIIEEEIIEHIREYLKQPKGNRDELVFALRLRDTFYKVMTLLERIYEFNKINGIEQRYNEAALKPDQKAELLRILTDEILPFKLKTFMLPDILEFGRFFNIEIQSKLNLLYDCLDKHRKKTDENKSENETDKTTKIISEEELEMMQNSLKDAMLDFTYGNQEVSEDTFANVVKKYLDECNAF